MEVRVNTRIKNNIQIRNNRLEMLIFDKKKSNEIERIEVRITSRKTTLFKARHKFWEKFLSG
ncbi:hypothetical protein CWI38_2367p0010 [Hamiltosporidium tvaerminnensis]|uniref:Uncharacterized protein n=1 Tax=Hamiltosporidium tvaerminnensis TaxID=1176355 RepID=A0A4V2JWE5_9MICR|nr:hypothetical protein CWI38_2367p0010 [Hamiltosporidium tvaerminnensis]